MGAAKQQAAEPAAVEETKPWTTGRVRKAIRSVLWRRGKLAPSGYDYALLDLIWERTWFARSVNPPEECRLQCQEIAREIGITGKFATDQVQKIVARLKKAGILATRKEGKDQVLWYRLTPQGWAAAPKYEPPPVLRMPPIDDESDDEPPAEDPAQAALPGLEHVALATDQARAIRLAAPTSELEFVSEVEGLELGISPAKKVGRVRVTLRESETPVRRDWGQNASTPVRPDGGSNAISELMQWLSGMPRGRLVTFEQAEAAWVQAGRPAIDHLTAKIAESMARAGANWKPAFLATCAKDVAKTWPAERKRRAAEAKAAKRGPAPTARCSGCGRLWADGCKCVPGVGRAS